MNVEAIARQTARQFQNVDRFGEEDFGRIFAEIDRDEGFASEAYAGEPDGYGGIFRPSRERVARSGAREERLRDKVEAHPNAQRLAKRLDKTESRHDLQVARRESFEDMRDARQERHDTRHDIRRSRKEGTISAADRARMKGVMKARFDLARGEARGSAKEARSEFRADLIDRRSRFGAEPSPSEPSVPGSFSGTEKDLRSRLNDFFESNKDLFLFFVPHKVRGNGFLMALPVATGIGQYAGIGRRGPLGEREDDSNRIMNFLRLMKNTEIAFKMSDAEPSHVRLWAMVRLRDCMLVPIGTDYGREDFGAFVPSESVPGKNRAELNAIFQRSNGLFLYFRPRNVRGNGIVLAAPVATVGQYSTIGKIPPTQGVQEVPDSMRTLISFSRGDEIVFNASDAYSYSDGWMGVPLSKCVVLPIGTDYGGEEFGAFSPPSPFPSPPEGLSRREERAWVEEHIDPDRRREFRREERQENRQERRSEPPPPPGVSGREWKRMQAESSDIFAPLPYVVESTVPSFGGIQEADIPLLLAEIDEIENEVSPRGGRGASDPRARKVASRYGVDFSEIQPHEIGFVPRSGSTGHRYLRPDSYGEDDYGIEDIRPTDKKPGLGTLFAQAAMIGAGVGAGIIAVSAIAGAFRK